MLNNERTRFMLSVSRVRENGVSKEWLCVKAHRSINNLQDKANKMRISFESALVMHVFIIWW